MPYDSDKTIADFDLEAFNREMEEKEKQNKKNATKPVEDELDDDFDDFDSLDSAKDDDFDDFDGLNSIDDDDLFEEDSSIKQKLSKVTKDSKAKTNTSEEDASGGRRRKKDSSPSPEKTMIASLDQVSQTSYEEDEDEEPSSDKTQILSLDQINSGDIAGTSNIVVELARLKIVEGGNLEEFSIKQDSSTLGRTENNDIVIPNNTISRNHCRFDKTPNGFKVVDLNSGNGIKVNGKKVPAKLLKSGDIISVGGLKIQFIDMSVEHYDSDTSDSVVVRGGKYSGTDPKTKKIILISAVAGILLLVGIVVFIMNKNKAEYQRKLAEQKKMEFLKKEKQIQVFFNKGLAAYKNKEWNSAIDNFDNALKLKPEFKEAENYKKAAKGEGENYDYVQGAEKDLINEDFKSALLKLQKVPETSVYYAQAQDNIKIANKKFRAYQLGIIQKNFDEENYDTAKTMVSELLEANPDFEDAIALQTQIDEKLINAEKDSKKTTKQTDTNKFDPNKYKKTTTNKSSGKNKYTEGLKLYGSKRFDEAVAFFQKISSAEALEYAKNIRDVKQLLDQGSKLIKLKDTSKGIPTLNKALSIDGKIGGQLSGEIGKDLSVLYGIRAQTLFGEKNYPEAYKFASKGATLNPSNDLNKKVLGLLSKKAKDMFLDAYMREARDPDAAKKIYKVVVSMIPASDPTAEKAKKRLK
ncbi:FHA domain-containing protein [bacterium]|nr:FHA domain-containing protein [bacterium]